MKNSNTKLRLRQIMDERRITQTDILKAAQPYCEKFNVKLNKSNMSQYVAGKNEPGQDKIAVLSMALDVSEGWLMGYDVPMERQSPEENKKPADNVDELVDAIRSDPRKYLLAKRLFELSDSEFDRIERVFDAMLDPLPEETDPVDQE